MAIHDYVIDNQAAPAFRADLNSVLQAIASTNAAATAPTVTYANMLWYDTTANQLKKRNEANSAWIIVGTFDEVASTFTPSGQPVTQVQATWDAGTSTVESLISAAKLDAKVRSELNAAGAAPLYACRAWVNFNGTGTVAIRASGNVSSITDNGVGNYTINFTTAFADTNYAWTGGGNTGSAVANTRLTVQARSGDTKTVSALEITTTIGVSDTTLTDVPEVNVMVFR